MAEAGRRGERAPNSRLSNRQAREARERYDRDEPIAKLAEEYGVHYLTMWRVLRRITYREA